MLNLGNKFKEFKKAAGTIFVCALLALAVGLSGCTGAASQDSLSGEVPAPEIEKKELKTLRQNPLELVQVDGEVTEGQSRMAFSYSTIDGLADKAVQDKINQKIEDVVQQQKTAGLPGFRGIKTRITDDHVLVDRQLNQIIQGSFNNILSMTIYTSQTYVHKDDLRQKEELGYYENAVYVSDTIPLVLDLNTGEDVQLKDLFHDDVDYMNVLNSWMDHHLDMSAANEEGWYPSGAELDLKLVGPFKGLSEDQKFYLAPFGLALLFGPEDAQFTSPYGFYSSTVSVAFHDLEGTWALDYRFMDEDTDLYTSQDPPVYSLLTTTGDTSAGMEEHYTEDRIAFNLALRYQEDLPGNIEEKIIEIGHWDEAIVQALKESLTSESSGYYDVSVYANCVGDYITLNFSESAYGWDENGDQCYDHFLNRYYTYHRETGELVELSDLFREGVDVDEALRAGMYAHQRRLSDLYDENPRSDEDIRAEVDRLYQNVNSFAVETTSISMLGSYEDPDTGMVRNEWISVAYEDIGCHLMTIFD